MTSGRQELPGGQWAVLCAPEEVFEGHRRPIKLLQARMASDPTQKAVRDEVRGIVGDDPEKIGAYLSEHADEYLERLMTEGAMDVVSKLQDATIISRVRAWSFTHDGQPLPITSDGLFFLPGPAYDALAQLVKDDPIEPDHDVNPDPASPTPPSAA